MKWGLAARFWSHFYHFGMTFGVNLGTLGLLLEHFGDIFGVKNVVVEPNVLLDRPRALTPEIGSPFWVRFGARFSDISMCLQ